VVDQATRDALARSQGAPVAEARATATVEDLRQAGSRTIAGADRLSLLAKVKVLFGLTTLGGAGLDQAGGFDLDTVQAGIDKAHQAAGMLDQIRPMLKAVFSSSWALPIGAAAAVVGILVLVDAGRIARARLEDHRSAANMGR
jgi:hypothetical protein